MTTHFELTQPLRQPTFSLAGFDAAVSSTGGGKGVSLIHQRAVPCPGGLTTAQDTRRSHPDHLGCSGGFIFREVGRCTALFAGNSKQERQTDAGVVASAQASVTFSRFYDGTQTPVRVSQFDRLYLPDDAVLVSTWQRFDSDPSGLDRMRYPVTQVVDLVTSAGVWMGSGDYSVEAGKVKWVGRRPAVQPDGRGEVCSIVYLYRPYWYVDGMHHDLRLMTQAGMDAEGNQMSVLHTYQSCTVSREFCFETEDNDPEAPDPASGRQRRPPIDPQLGPR